MCVWCACGVVWCVVHMCVWCICGVCVCGVCVCRHTYISAHRHVPSDRINQHICIYDAYSISLDCCKCTNKQLESDM